MQIVLAAQSQTLNSNAVSQELRSREVQQFLSSSKSLPVEEELQSSRNLFNRDRVTISPQAAELSRLASTGEAQLETEEGEFVGLESSGASPQSSITASRAETEEIERRELEQTRELSKRDREVRAHEQAHAAIGGQYASAPSFTYERGPDGRLYAVEGEVKIDTSPIPNDPEATLEKAETIQRAALGVAEPSPADRAAAADARAMASDARAELLRQDEQQRTAQAEARSSDEEQDEDDNPTAGERLQEFRDQQQARSSGAAEALEDFNDLLTDINKQLAEINKKLVDAGVLQKLIPEGAFLDQRV
jgi:hypothetical protein